MITWCNERTGNSLRALFGITLSQQGFFKCFHNGKQIDSLKK